MFDTFINVYSTLLRQVCGRGKIWQFKLRCWQIDDLPDVELHSWHPLYALALLYFVVRITIIYRI